MSSAAPRSYDELVRVQGWGPGYDLLGLCVGADFNACELLVDQLERAGKVALVCRTYEGARKVLTFGDLREGAARFASVLDSLGVTKGDRVFTLLEPVPELYMALLGTIRAGAVAGPLFPAFGAEAIHDRLEDSGARVLVVGSRHLHKVRPLLRSLPALEHVLVVGPRDLGEREQDWVAAMGCADPDRPATLTRASDPMLMHYSSGTTGRPKGVLHVHEALVGHAFTAKVVLDLGPEDTYWCTADPGWVTGTSYGVFGPWSLGIRQVAYCGGFSASHWYQVIQDEGITVWYTSPTALRMLMKEGRELTQEFNLSSLRHICSVGEPLNPEIIRWGQDAFGLVIHDTWWQTETGCIQIANYPFMEVRPGSMGRPFAGVRAAIVDPRTGEAVGPLTEGVLALRPPWPSMFRAYWRREDLYGEKFRNGWYLTGDRAYVDADGYYWFIGRDDDVINTSGHLVGPFEVESALLTHEAVVEAAVFSIPDEGAGEAVAAKVVLVPGREATKELVRELKSVVRHQVGSHAVPRDLVFVDHLPRTRSGKIMRRVARAEYLGLPLGDISALEE